MKIVVACDSFKNCLTSEEVANSIKKGIHLYNPSFEVNTFTTSDGGEGSVATFVKQCQGIYVETETYDAYRKKISVKYGLIDHQQTAVIEVASVIGLSLTPIKERRVMQTSSYGVGKLLLDAKKRNVKKIILCLGGSCTNDVGVGLLEALGAKFYNIRGEQIYTNSGSLRKIHRIDFSSLEDFSMIKIIVASDVRNKLLGKEGCTFCFGKQKGVHLSKMEFVDSCMQHYVNIVKKSIGIDLNMIVSGGAAGGIGSAVIGILKGKAVSGIHLVIETCGIENAISKCDLVITGEGQSDYQTQFGKVPMGILEVANKYNKPTLCISGALGKQYRQLYDFGFLGLVSIADRAMSFEQAIRCASEKLTQTAYTQIRIIDYYRK